MAAHDHDHSHPDHPPRERRIDAGAQEQDPGSQSLAEALRLSFWLLKLLMVALVVVYIASGFFIVDQKDVALVLQFGKIRGPGLGEKLGPGLHWAPPFPIGERVIISTGSRTLDVGTFWYAISEQEVERALKGDAELAQGLVPGGKGGYLLTGDRNIVNAFWRVNYDISDPIAFFLNVRDTVSQAEQRLVSDVIDAAAVRETAKYKVFDVLSPPRPSELPNSIQAAAQRDLDSLDAGIRIASVERKFIQPPRDVKSVFDQVTQAEIRVGQRQDQARAEATKKLNQAAGTIGVQLVELLQRIDAAETPDEKAPIERKYYALLSTAKGDVSKLHAEAEQYRNDIAKDAKGDADYMTMLLSRYGDNPAALTDYLKQYRIAKLETILLQAEDKYQVSTGGLRFDPWLRLSPPTELLKERRRPAKVR